MNIDDLKDTAEHILYEIEAAKEIDKFFRTESQRFEDKFQFFFYSINDSELKARLVKVINTEIGKRRDEKVDYLKSIQKRISTDGKKNNNT